MDALSQALAPVAINHQLDLVRGWVGSREMLADLAALWPPLPRDDVDATRPLDVDLLETTPDPRLVHLHSGLLQDAWGQRRQLLRDQAEAERLVRLQCHAEGHRLDWVRLVADPWEFRRHASTLAGVEEGVVARLDERLARPLVLIADGWQDGKPRWRDESTGLPLLGEACHHTLAGIALGPLDLAPVLALLAQEQPRWPEPRRVLVAGFAPTMEEREALTAAEIELRFLGPAFDHWAARQ